MMILQALRASSYHEDRLRQGLWHDHTVMAKDARKSTLGVVGMGKIGKMGTRSSSTRIAHIANGLTIYSCRSHALVWHESHLHEALSFGPVW